MDERWSEKVQNTFTLYGLIISRNLSASLAKQLLSINESERDEWLTKIIDQVLTQDLKDPHVSKEQLKTAIDECIQPDKIKNEEEILCVINAFDIPKIKYDRWKEKYVIDTTAITEWCPDPESKIMVMKNRFELLWYRTLKHKLFSPPAFGEKLENKVKLTPIEYLTTETGDKDVCVMGLLTQLKECQFYLEDPDAYIKIDLKKARFQNKLIIEGSIVIATGTYTKGVLEVDEIGFPPAELVDNSRAHLGDINTFGGKNPTLCKISEKLKAYEEQHPNDMIVFISELWLDSSVVLEKFKTILEGYADDPPVAFVLCGHFVTIPTAVHSFKKMKEGFKCLADIIQEVPSIKEKSKFILVPGPHDPGASQILPRITLPHCLTDDFVKRVPNTILATNPCRIQYCTKEIVVLRQDILTRMCRNALCTIKNEDKIFDDFATSIICQSHLTPFNLPFSPVYWAYDHALYLYPTPDLIVVADQFSTYSYNYLNCHVMNPGMFSRNRFSFKVYVPALNIIEDCEVPENTDEAQDGDK